MGGRILAASFAIALAIVLPRKTEAQCGAICLYEVGSPDNGMSAAGASARAQDAATALFNIAGTTRLDGFQVMAASVLGFIDQEFKVNDSTQPPNAGNSGGSLGDFVPLGAAFLSLEPSEKFPLRFAFSFSGMYGGRLDYDNDWAGRTGTTETSLVGLNMAPGLAYALIEKKPYCRRLSVGGAIDVLFLKLEYQQKASLSPLSPTLEINDAKDWTVAGTIALLYELSDATRIGLNYRTPADVNLSGDFDQVSTTARFDSKFDLAQGLNLGFFHAFTPELAVLADVGWSDWSTFDYQAISFDSVPGNPIARNFEDTWRVGAGMQYSPGATEAADGNWRFSGGFSFDSSPVDAKHRLPDVPVSEQYRFSLGYQKIAGNLRLGGGYTFFWAANNEIKDAHLPDFDSQGQPLPDVILNGEYDRSYAHFLSVSVEVRFAGFFAPGPLEPKPR